MLQKQNNCVGKDSLVKNCLISSHDADYSGYKESAEEANAKKEQLWDEAKHLGRLGDRNADRHLSEMDKRMQVWLSALPCHSEDYY
jgi:hypothetical protein